MNINCNSINKCKFCDIVNGHIPNSIENSFLWETEHFVVLPALGQFVAGYYLIIPKKHYTSFSQLPENLHKEISDLKRNVENTIKNIWEKECLVFEHGMLISNNSGCIEHAHLHIIPSNIDIPQILDNFQYIQLPDFKGIYDPKLQSENYLYFEARNKYNFYPIVKCDDFPKQYLRRIIYREIGCEGNGWDWKKHSHLDNIKTSNELINNYMIAQVN